MNVATLLLGIHSGTYLLCMGPYVKAITGLVIPSPVPEQEQLMTGSGGFGELLSNLPRDTGLSPRTDGVLPSPPGFSAKRSRFLLPSDNGQ